MTKAYVATRKGGEFAIIDVPSPKPQAGEVSIRNKAVALNPVDWKKHQFGIMVDSWPAVFGSDVAGVIESVGEGVNAFSPGDEVFSLTGHDSRAGGFQEFSTVPEYFVAHKPPSLSFEEAASLPICYLTAAAAITLGLRIRLPFLQNNESTAQQSLRSVLVVGGGSGVGASAIQLLRLSVPTLHILATASQSHHSQLISLGATSCIDRGSPDIVRDIMAASASGQGVDAILDAVGGAGDESQPFLFDTLRSDGPKRYSAVSTGSKLSIPVGVDATTSSGRQAFDVAGGRRAMSALGKLTRDGDFKPPLKIEVVGQGLESIGNGLEKLKSGVSRTKLIIVL
ncbi:chaperonin 10-like protein [Diaporthe sp. PMI_573]|nr:chaperonin 10-like protein [Diaporthaceae sp. PMI_573]